MTKDQLTTLGRMSQEEMHRLALHGAACEAAGISEDTLNSIRYFYREDHDTLAGNGVYFQFFSDDIPRPTRYMTRVAVVPVQEESK